MISLDDFFACVGGAAKRDWRPFATLSDAAFAAAAAFADRGFTAIVDTVFER